MSARLAGGAIADLRKHPAFARASEAKLAELTSGAALLELDRGAIVFRAGEPAESLYVLVEGVVRVFHTAPTGEELTVKHLLAPATFAEMELLAEDELLEDVEILERARLIKIPAAQFRAFLAEDAWAARVLLIDISARFCSAARHERAPFFDLPVRLAAYLLSLAELFGRPSSEGLLIRYPVTQADLADGLGVVVRSVRRTLTEWKSKGWIGQHKGWIVIKNKPELEALAHGLRFNLNHRFPNELLER
jgi:CRP-like cAMP-binding protein